MTSETTATLGPNRSDPDTFGGRTWCVRSSPKWYDSRAGPISLETAALSSNCSIPRSAQKTSLPARISTATWSGCSTRPAGSPTPTPGCRAFFSVGQTKHLDLCKKPVFLDFGFDVVPVERFTDAITTVSGFGLVHSRQAFTDTYLSDVRQPGTSAMGMFAAEERTKSPCDRKSPVWKLQRDTKWTDPTSGRTMSYVKWKECIKVDYYTYTIGDSRNKRWDYENVIDRHPEIANGWTKDGLRQMLEFFRGTAVILDGLLRVLPSPAESIAFNGTVSATEHLLRLADGHIQAGRLPVLTESTKEVLLLKAQQSEISHYGRPLRPSTKPIGQRSLFE